MTFQNNAVLTVLFVIIGGRKNYNQLYKILYSAVYYVKIYAEVT